MWGKECPNYIPSGKQSYRTWTGRIPQLHCSFSAVNFDTFYGTEQKALNCVFMFLWEFRLEYLPTGQAAAYTHNIEDRSNGEVI